MKGYTTPYEGATWRHGANWKAACLTDSEREDTNGNHFDPEKLSRAEVLFPYSFSSSFFFSHAKDVDTVIIRENTEGEYCGVEHEVRIKAIELKRACRHFFRPTTRAHLSIPLFPTR